MKRINLECICKLAENMTVYVNNNSKCGDYPIISAYCKFDVARDLVESLIKMGNSLGNIIELEEYEMSYYDKEFVIYLSKDGIACEKCYHENTYYYGGGDISYVHEDCNSKLLDYIESDVIFEFGFKDEDSCEPMCGSECCGCCDCDEDDDYPHEVDYENNESDNMHGFNVNKSDDNGYYSYSFYSTDKNLVEQMAKMFGR